MTETKDDPLTFNDVIWILEDEIETHERNEPYEELDFNAPCNQKG